jgi:3-dehydroquinate dehydratase type I
MNSHPNSPKTENRKPKTPFPLRLCVPVVEATASRARRAYLRAARKGLWAEMRLDYLEKPELPRLFRTLPGPVIVTNRPRREGGRWAGEEKARLALLAEALKFGVQALDVEFSADPGFRRDLFLRKGPTKLILSWHEFQETPEDEKLEEILTAMVREKAEILKLVTWARRPEDNLRVLGLIPRAREAGKEIIAFCMGPLGKWSRLAAPLLGSYLSYAPLQAGKTSAPGQVTVNEMRRLFRLLRP